MSLYLAQDADADALLDRDPFALLLGMMLDQQIPMEKAFSGPKLLAERMGAERLDPADIAGHDPDAFARIFAGPPAIHRFPGAMAARAQALATVVAERYDGDAAAIWDGANSGDQLLKRLGELPGFGEQKARIFLALLGKQRGVRPRGWRTAAGRFGDDGIYHSVADVTSAESLQKVREFKKEMKAAAKQAARKPTR
jgi:uncharacterized HhH-GPD family protein